MKQGNYDKALELFIRAYKIYLTKLGSQHPHAKMCRENMGIDYQAAQRKEPFDQWLAAQLNQ
jgi:hypothetical protein